MNVGMREQGAYQMNQADSGSNSHQLSLKWAAGGSFKIAAGGK